MEHDTGRGADPAAGPSTPATGERRVDAALSRLGELDELTVSEHPAVYESIHEQLVEVLGELHSAQAPTGQGSSEAPEGQGSDEQGAG